MNGLVTLVTGGAAGLGLACVKRFTQQGARVIICDLPTSKGNDIVENWSSKYASSNESENNSIVHFKSDIEKPAFFPTDVTNEEQVQTTFNQIKKQYGKLDVVLNCVGIGIALQTYNMNKVRIKKKKTILKYLFSAFNA